MYTIECGEPSGKDIDVVVNQIDTAVSDAITRCASDFETIPDGQTDASPQTFVDSGSMLAEPAQTELVVDTMVVDGKLMLPIAADDVDFPTLQVSIQKKREGDV
ncbi:hypothetical protein V6N11_033904 [Hibiscus sabdariffa]|uniref:Uncharacterized protein n=1 Tax=Hibiscus sabdariffa TaxID=183260 RepID=A0ABR2S0U8_9ROSI